MRDDFKYEESITGGRPSPGFDLPLRLGDLDMGGEGGEGAVQKEVIIAAGCALGWVLSCV